MKDGYWVKIEVMKGLVLYCYTAHEYLSSIWPVCVLSNPGGYRVHSHLKSVSFWYISIIFMRGIQDYRDSYDASSDALSNIVRAYERRLSNIWGVTTSDCTSWIPIKLFNILQISGRFISLRKFIVQKWTKIGQILAINNRMSTVS